MTALNEVLEFDPNLLVVLVLDLSIAMALLLALRFLTGLLASVNTTDELSQKDNFAFGLELAGAISALAIMLSGAIEGDVARTLGYEALLMLSYGVLGVLLIKAGRVIQDQLVLRQIAIKAEIMDGNLAVATMDFGHVVSIAIIIRAVMIWVDSNTFVGLTVVLAGFVISQIILMVTSRFRMMRYASRNPGKELMHALADGHLPLAIRYAGHMIGVALAVTAASHFVSFEPDYLWYSIGSWGVLSIILTLLLSVLNILSRKVILVKVNVVEEVDEQKNLGVAAVEGSIFIALGILLAALMA